MKNKSSVRLGLMKKKKVHPLYNVLFIASGIMGACSGSVRAEEYFNPALLSLGVPGGAAASSVDLSRFEAGGQMPGVYRVDIYLNGQYMASRDVNFVAGSGTELNPELTLKEYTGLGLNVKAVPALKDTATETSLAPLSKYVPSGATQFDFSQQRLDITIPQALLSSQAQGFVDPASWDEGVPAAILDYNFNGNHTSNRGDNASSGDSDDQYASFRSGLNLLGWRLRNYSTWSRSSGKDQDTQSHFNSINTYVAHDVKSLQGEFIAGEYSTPGDVFDSVQYRGAQISSDQGMLPDSLRGFAPIIRGVANSSAQVTVRQNGNVIYQAYVPAGPFEIKDLYPSSDSGDLDVSVKEKDGSERHFTQAYSSVAIMQREGQVKYSLTAGELRDSGNNNLRESNFVQATLIYGMPHNITPYIGLLIAQKYRAATGGVGMSMGDWGAVSVDATQADATLTTDEHSQGQSYRIRYSKSMLETGTTVTMAAYRYSTEGYYSFQDANTYRDRQSDGDYWSSYRPRSEFNVTLNQTLGGYGSVYLSGTQRDYWGQNGTERTYNAGYSTSIYGASYSLGVSQSKRSDSDQKEDRRLNFNVSVPLDRLLAGNNTASGNNMNLNYGMNTDRNHNTSQRMGISGSALGDNQLNYNVDQSTGNHGQGYAGSLGATYNGSLGSVSGGYNYSDNQQQLTYGLSGGVVAHPHGITLGQEPGETIAIVRAPGASGVKVNNQNGVETDWRGYAIVPYMQPYRSNEVELDPSNVGDSVAMDLTSARVVPTRGAVVMANYRTQVGRQAMLNLMFRGKPIPFGALATLDARNLEDGQKAANGIVGDAGQLFMSGLPDEGLLNLQWGSDADAHCSVPFRLPAEREDRVPVSVTAVCQ
ncbi:fimbria/pilus outer membrane usher protein [Enterobacter ludwigii]|uniref:fimbria/pilus outer membrane usher protein n=1 Tax=Enterobacter ludwigii TaxID=299767 RepID=UPI0030767356